MIEHKNPFLKFLKIIFSVFAIPAFKIIANGEDIIASFFPDTSIIRKWGVISIALLLIPLATWGQVDGDYQTRATGNWNDNNTWQVRSLGSWVNCIAGDYPGAAGGAGTVFITGGSTVSVTADIVNSIGAVEFVGNSASNIVQFSGSNNLNVLRIE